MTISPEMAARFAREWIEAWNAHDLDRILSHYAEAMELSSPAIARLAGQAVGRLKGKQAVRAYWTQALALYPNLRFTPVCTMLGVESLVIHYRGVADKRVAEMFHFDRDGLVSHASAHYEA